MLKYGSLAVACFVAGFAVLAIAQTTAEMESEAGADLKKADAELNKVYKELRETLSDSEKEGLKEVQRLWITFRDKNADFEASLYEGGSIAGLVRLSSLTSATEARVADLKGMFREGYPEEEATGQP